MGALTKGREVVLDGTVGNLGMDASFTASDVRLALTSLGDGPITVRLNSGGGIASEGVAIHSILSAHKGRKTVVVEGVAASAASVLAMAGDTVVMSLGSTMMVHDPSGMTVGTADDHGKSAAALNTIGDAMASIYARKTGKPLASVRADMRAEKWMTASEAVAAGYADRAETSGRLVQPRAFDYRAYRHAPERLVALADRSGWTTNRPAASSASMAVASMRREIAKLGLSPVER